MWLDEDQGSRLCIKVAELGGIMKAVLEGLQ